MTSQIFKKRIPKKLLFELLDKICIKNNKYYSLDKISYKKGEYLQLFNLFYDSIISYYHISKQFYIRRKKTYNSFNTIIRQICKYHNINYTSKIIYDKSTYFIVYYIYYEI